MPKPPSPADAKYRREWSKILGRRRLDAFERAIADPDLVSLKQELALIDLRADDVRRQAVVGASEQAWQEVKLMARTLTELLEQPDEKVELAKLREVVVGLAQTVERGLDEWRVWDELKDLIERRRRLADTERKYEEMKHLLVPVAELALLFDDLHAAIEAVIVLPELRRALLHELRVRINDDPDSRNALRSVRLPASYLVELPASHDAGEGGTPVADQPPGEDGGAGASPGAA